MERRNELKIYQRKEIYFLLSRLYRNNSEYSRQKDILLKIGSDIGIENLERDEKNRYFDERRDNILRSANYSKYLDYPPQELSDDIEASNSDLTRRDWDIFYDEWKRFYHNMLTSADSELYEQIHEVVETKVY